MKVSNSKLTKIVIDTELVPSENKYVVYDEQLWRVTVVRGTGLKRQIRIRQPIANKGAWITGDDISKLKVVGFPNRYIAI